MISLTDRLAANQTQLAFTISDTHGVFFTGFSEMPVEALREKAKDDEAILFFCSQTAILLAVNKYLALGSSLGPLKALINKDNKSPDPKNRDDDFSLSIESLYQPDDDGSDPFLSYDFSMRLVASLENMMDGLNYRFTSPFTEMNLGRSNTEIRLSDVPEFISRTINVMTSEWPSEIVKKAQNQVYDYQTADSFLTPVGYLEMVRQSGKAEVGLDRSMFGSINIDECRVHPPINYLIAKKSSFPAASSILTTLDLIFESGSRTDGESREYLELRASIASTLQQFGKIISKNSNK